MNKEELTNILDWGLLALFSLGFIASVVTSNRDWMLHIILIICMCRVIGYKQMYNKLKNRLDR